MKHRLTKEGTTQADPVEPTDEPVGVPALHRVRVTGVMQRAVAFENLVVDPVPLRVLSRGAGGDHVAERAVHGALKALLPYQPGQPPGRPELVERNHAATFR